MMLFVVLGCTVGPGEDTDALEPLDMVLEVAATQQALVDELEALAGFSEVDHYTSLEDGEEEVFWEGEASDPVDGVSLASGTGRYQREDATFRHVYWTLDVTLSPGADATASGWTSLSTDQTLFEGTYTEHEVSGALLQGEAEASLSYSALFVGAALQSIDGSLDGEAVAWETEDPDVP